MNFSSFIFRDCLRFTPDKAVWNKARLIGPLVAMAITSCVQSLEAPLISLQKQTQGQPRIHSACPRLLGSKFVSAWDLTKISLKFILSLKTLVVVLT